MFAYSEHILRVADCKKLSKSPEGAFRQSEPETGGASHFFEDFYKKFFPKYVIEDNLVITGLSLRVKNERRNE